MGESADGLTKINDNPPIDLLESEKYLNRGKATR